MLLRLLIAAALALSLSGPEHAFAQRAPKTRATSKSRANKARKTQTRRVTRPSTRRVRTPQRGLRRAKPQKNWAKRKPGKSWTKRKPGKSWTKRKPRKSWTKRKPRNTRNTPKTDHRLRRRRMTVSRDPDTDINLRREAAKSSENSRRPLRLEAKNRGRLATLKGIRKGKTYRLINPTTGKLDTKAVVIQTGTNKWSKVPFAKVKFSNGHIAKYAAERLNLVGKSRAVQLKYIRAQREVLFSAIENQLGHSPKGAVKLKSLRGRNVQPRKRKLKSGKNAKPHLGPFIKGIGEKLAPSEGLLGYQLDGEATVSRHHAAFDIATPTHEVLHGMSQKFIDQMFDKKLVNTLEGITDYFTFKVVRPQYGVQQKPSDAYRKYTVFAKQIADKIGDDKLQEIFFGKRGNLVERLSKSVDAEVGKKGAFMRAARKLEKGTLVPIE